MSRKFIFRIILRAVPKTHFVLSGIEVLVLSVVEVPERENEGYTARILRTFDTRSRWQSLYCLPSARCNNQV